MSGSVRIGPCAPESGARGMAPAKACSPNNCLTVCTEAHCSQEPLLTIALCLTQPGGRVVFCTVHCGQMPA